MPLSTEVHTVPNSATVTTSRKKKKSGKTKKRQKKITKMATPTVPNETRRTTALEYLRHWSTDRQTWSFRKITQYWLLNNIYSKKQIGKSDFAILVRYLEGISDFQRSRLIKDAEKIIKNYPNDQTIRLHYKRAKKIVSGIKV